MGDTDDENDCSQSTTWAWKRVKIDSPLAAPNENSRRAPSKALRSVWNPRTTLTLTVRYRGGAECWYEVRARGRIHRLPGHVALHDVMGKVYGEHAR